jgi:TolB protein
MNADGTGVVRLAHVSGYSLAWSPLGDRFAVADARDGFGETCFHECTPSAEVYTLAADGSQPTRLTTHEGDDESPAWSPDGSALAFTSDRTDPADHDTELYLMRPDGSCVTRLTDNSSDVWEGSPAWRPTANMTHVRLAC